MVAGHLREQNGYFQMILSWKDSNGKRRSKSISTGLPIKGNKKRAEAMLLKAREEFNLENLVENANVPLCDFFQKWLKDRAISMGARVYANYAYDVKAYIAPYFRENPVSVLKVTSKELEAFYRFERQEDDATPEDLLQYHEVVTACLGYAEELGWIEENPAEEVNPCADQAPILFDEFIREWLEIIRSKIGEITYASYKRNVEKCIAPYFKARRYTLQDLERHPKYIQEFYQSMLDSGLSPSTVIRRHANVRKCLQYAFQIGLIKSNPADRVEKPRKIKYEATIYNEEELNLLFKTVKGDPLELAVIVGAFYGLRRSEVVGLKWDAIDFKKKTISIRHTVVQFNLDGQNQIVRKDSTKTKSSCRTLPLVPPFELLLHHLKEEQSVNQKVCGDCYCRDYLEYIYVDAMGNLIKPNFITQHFEILLKKNNLKKIRFHDLRHPYVKHTTKIFSLRLMDFQAQACPDARRKTRGACQLLRVGQSRSPVRPLCNRKRFSCLPPQSKMSWILYAISMRLSGYTSTRSISSSASSVVSVSASKIALDASMRLSCRACSSCFCFACANTAA